MSWRETIHVRHRGALRGHVPRASRPASVAGLRAGPKSLREVTVCTDSLVTDGCILQVPLSPARYRGDPHELARRIPELVIHYDF